MTGGFDDQYYNDGLKSEIIDLENENLVCEDLSNAPYVISYGTGGFVNNNPVICGGFDGSKQLNICFVLGQNDILTLEYARSVAASIVFNNKVSKYFLIYLLFLIKQNLIPVFSFSYGLQEVLVIQTLGQQGPLKLWRDPQ